MIGERIKELRAKQGMTQKDLADKLFVTAQAVSRWENNEVEPSISTLSEMGKIFSVSIDELIGNAEPTKEVEVKEEKQEQKVIVEKEVVYKEAPPVLAVCERCNKPIYKSNEIVRHSSGRNHHYVWCASCDKQVKEMELERKREFSLRRRTMSFWLGGLAGVVCILVGIILGANGHSNLVAPLCISSVFAFTLVSCLLLANNFVGDMVSAIMEFGFVKCPSLIFSLDLDGIIWLLTVKLTFWILGICLAIVMGILAIAIGMVVSIFVYPFALVKNIQNPEDVDDI